MDYEEKYKTALKGARIRKEIIKLINNTCKGEWFIDSSKEDCLAWLEKQGEKKPLYIRFGDVPSNETSKIYRGEVEIGEENGVSVYPAFELNGNVVLGLTLPITKTTLYTQQHLLEYDNRPCYLVTGDFVGKGSDGEPLINNVKILRRITEYRVKGLKNESENKGKERVISPNSWSDEDENNLTDVCVAIREFYHGSTNGAQELIDWLKSFIK